MPPLSEITARRAEREQLDASILKLGNRGARLQHDNCIMPEQTTHFCVLIAKNPIMFPNTAYSAHREHGFQAIVNAV